jgi:hypothetical protein
MILSGLWSINCNDVFTPQATGIDIALSRLDPITTFAKGVVVDFAARFQPLGHQLRLLSIRIDSVLVGEVYHNAIVAHPREKIELPKMASLRHNLFISALLPSLLLRKAVRQRTLTHAPFIPTLT